ncbi:MAG: RNA-directed DNA polymerase [Burkholderiales bacterium]|nr:RNA-directed DNA polymerase [Opitutaceae bacterium]
MGLWNVLARLFGGGSASTNPTPPTQPQDARAPVGMPYGRGSAVNTPPPPPRTLARPGSPSPTRPAPTNLNLDPGQFAPVGAAELKKRAGELRWNWASVNFDRRDQIPSAGDPRTALIDRALVAQGLLTPEQLVEIHETGAQMAELRPELRNLQNIAADAALADEAERRARKEAKKAEADRRRAERAEAIKQRRATDIVFLGRGVSGGLADRRANIERLQALGLPVLATPADVAKALGLEVSRLRWLAFHSEAAAVTHYVRFQIPKKSGGTRELAAPHRDLARCQEWVRIQILDRVDLHDAAHGFVTGRGTLTNARPHLGRAAVVNADLKDFFPTITFPRVKGVFQQLGYSPASATVLALLCTECPRGVVNYDGRELHVATGPRGLPQGACTSPALSNLVARGLDNRLSAFARRLGWTYTRYADDLTFSADGEAMGQTARLLTGLRHIVGDESFVVNEKKTRVQRPKTRQTVTGIVVNRHPNVPRDTVRRLRAILHRAKTEGLTAQNREAHPHFEGWVRGMIAYVAMVNPERGRELLAEFELRKR